MIKLINDWYKQHFSNPQVAILAILLIIGLSIIIFAGHILKPILAAVVLAYLLDGGVEWLRQFKIPRTVSVLLVFSVFLLSVTLLLFVLAPILLKQASQFVLAVPSMISTGQQALMLLPEKYPNIISEQVVIEILSSLRTHVTQLSQEVLTTDYIP
jgi:putative permease